MLLGVSRVLCRVLHVHVPRLEVPRSFPADPSPLWLEGGDHQVLCMIIALPHTQESEPLRNAWEFDTHLECGSPPRVERFLELPLPLYLTRCVQWVQGGVNRTLPFLEIRYAGEG